MYISEDDPNFFDVAYDCLSPVIRKRMSSLYVQGRNKNHHHSDDDEMANGNRTHKIHVCMLLSDTTLPHTGPAWRIL